MQQFCRSEEYKNIKIEIMQVTKKYYQIRNKTINYYMPILKEYGYNSYEEFQEDYEPDQTIYKRFDKVHKENGLDIKNGYCPILIAEYDVRQLENKAIEMIEKLTGKIGYDYILRKKVIKLFMTDIKGE